MQTVGEGFSTRIRRTVILALLLAIPTRLQLVPELVNDPDL